MHIKFHWEKNFDCNLVLSKLAACREIKGNQCSFEGAGYAYWLPILNSGIRAGADIGILKLECIRKAASDPRELLNNSEHFLNTCQAKYVEISKGSKKKYLVLCPITYTGPRLFSTITDDNCLIRWQLREKDKRYKKLLSERNGLSHLLKSHRIVTSTENQTTLVVEVNAFDIYHANELAEKSIDKLRGVLNLIINSQRNVNPFPRFSKTHAVNRIRPGPYRTVHNQDGSLATEMFWYEPRWSHEVATIKFKGDTKNTTKGILKLWTKTRSNRLSKHIAEGLVRYCRALDQHDMSGSLVDLWSTLEFMTGTLNERYELTVNRIVSLFKDKAETRLVATHLKLRRNAAVHVSRGLNSEEADTVLLHADLLVRQILFFCINHGNRFEGLAELVQFLDMKTDRVKLASDNRLASFWIKYQNR